MKGARARYRDVLERWNSGELHRKRAKFDSFFERTGDLAERLEKAKAVFDKYF